MTSINEALRKIYDTIKPIDTKEPIDIIDAEGRICAQDIIAKIDLPKFDHSAMDGYGIRIQDCGTTRKYLRVLFAGDKNIAPLQDGEIIKIMTGAPIPQGVEAIVPTENTLEENGTVTLPSDVRKGANIRKKGEELKVDTVCLKRGEMINSYTIALLSSQGISEIDVFKRINATVLSNGNELKNYKDTAIDPLEIYNSNTPMFFAKIRSLGCCSFMDQSTSDDLEAIKNTIVKAAKKSELVIITGGASTGDRDFTKQALTQLGAKILFNKVDIKPGKPTSVAVLDGSIIISLPGNPLAAMVNFEIFATSIIAILQGSKDIYHKIIKTTFSNNYKVKPGKYSAICGFFDGKSFTPLHNQSPNQVSTLKEINAIAITDPSINYIEKNCDINIIDLKNKIDKKESIFILPQEG
ncbi:MAG: molybdopterin molybdotransferase MoeA [Campylobacterales bacterium]|nr:molybdopterin molybdotransferase MoeA [Campylobacterales bacterium]